VYVIGGLVDRTVRKGATLRLAQHCGAQAVRLPVAEHLEGLAKPVLNVNDVFAVLLAVHGGEGWREALERAIPARFRQQLTDGTDAQVARPPAGSACEQQLISSPPAPAEAASTPCEAAAAAADVGDQC
jgi:tRNA (guanine9-N1)-methyltransferase